MVLRILGWLPVCLVSFVCWTARAEMVLVACSSECPPALFDALELELRGHGEVLVARPAPVGFSTAARAADAQRLTELLGTGATLWIEAELPLRVRVLSARTGKISEAPLAQPLDRIEARVFAAVAGSVVLEALAAADHAPATETPVAAPGPEAAAASETVPNEARGVTQPISSDARKGWPAPSKAETWKRRFFVRVGAALGLALVRPGLAADRPPGRALADAGLTAQQQAGGDPGVAKAFVKAHGYDCKVEETTLTNESQGLLFSNCNVTVHAPGVVFVPAIDIATGANVTPRLALAFTARIAPAGYGTLAHALLGIQAEWQLTQPKRQGFWTSAALGLGVGRIQALLPAARAHHAPFVTSGLFNARAGLLLGYRFVPRVGLVAAPIVHFMAPDRLWVIDTTFSLEVRI